MYDVFVTNEENRKFCKENERLLNKMAFSEERKDFVEKLNHIESELLNQGEVEVLLLQYLNKNGFDKLKYLLLKKEYKAIAKEVSNNFNKDDFSDTLKSKFLCFGMNSSGKSSFIKTTKAYSQLEQGKTLHEIYHDSQDIQIGHADTTKSLFHYDIDNDKVFIDSPGILNPSSDGPNKDEVDDRVKLVKAMMVLPIENFYLFVGRPDSIYAVQSTGIIKSIFKNITDVNKDFTLDKSKRLEIVYVRQGFENKQRTLESIEEEFNVIQSLLDSDPLGNGMPFHVVVSKIIISPYISGLSTLNTVHANINQFNAHTLLHSDDLDLVLNNNEMLLKAVELAKTRFSIDVEFRIPDVIENQLEQRRRSNKDL